MIEIIQHNAFKEWLNKVKDHKARYAIATRLDRLAFGLFGGDVKPVGEGLSELRIDVGKGYRVYFKKQGNKLIVVFCGSQKKDQQKQIEKAKELAREWRKDNE